MALIDGEVTSKQFAFERFTETGIVKFLQGVKVERNAELSAMYPGARVANIVHVELERADDADGASMTNTGPRQNPLKDSEVEGKFRVPRRAGPGEEGEESAGARVELEGCFWRRRINDNKDWSRRSRPTNEAGRHPREQVFEKSYKGPCRACRMRRWRGR